MPLLLIPYTVGTQLGAAAATATGGAYPYRKRRYLAYMTAVLACLLVGAC